MALKTEDEIAPKRGRPRSDVPSKKVHIPMSHALFEELQQLKEDVGEASVASLIRASLVVFSALHEAEGEGAEILIRRKDGSIEKLILVRSR